MKYGVRDIVDVTLRAKGTVDLGNKRFYKNEPVLYFDTLTTSTLEGASTTVYAQGGKGNARLMAWEGERTVTFTMEDALISPESLSILTGAGLIEADKYKPIYQHIVESTDDMAIATDTDTVSGNVVTVYVEKEPFLPKPKPAEGTTGDLIGPIDNENYAFIMFTKDGEIISEPYVVSQRLEDGGQKYAVQTDETEPRYTPATQASAPHAGKYALIIEDHNCNFGLDCKDTGHTQPKADHVYYSTNLATDFAKANGVIVDYYTPVRSGAKQIEIDAEQFGGTYYLEGSTLFRDTNGVDHPAEFVIPNCKVQSAFTFTMSASGDPSTFTFTMDAFPDYTRFDKTHKVFAAIQIMESATAASDANNNLHRGQTWHGGTSYADVIVGSGDAGDNHDN